MAPGHQPPASDGWRRSADRNIEQIESADVFVMVASPEHIDGSKRVPGGKFFEAGYAHALRFESGHLRKGECRIRVFTLGGVEIGMLYTTGITHLRDNDELLSHL